MRKQTLLLFFYSAFFVSLIALDRITKYMMRGFNKNYSFNDFVTFTLQYNRGISWGMFDSENSIIFFVITFIIGVLISLFMVYTITRFLNNKYIFAEVMVCAGALSNMIDRIWYGGVADFILISGRYFSWPVFNMADVFIVIGLSSMIITGFLYEKN